jgi:multiphosphoryl transfer protein
VVVTSGQPVNGARTGSGRVRAGQDVCLSLLLQGEPGPSAVPEPAPGRKVASEAVVVPNPTGLANLAKKFQSKILLQRGEDQANAKSVVALMRLEVC